MAREPSCEGQTRGRGSQQQPQCMGAVMVMKPPVPYDLTMGQCLFRILSFYRFLNVKAIVAVFNQEKDLVEYGPSL